MFVNCCHYHCHISPSTHLSVDAALDSPAIYRDIFLFVIECVAFGNPDHLLHQVQPSNTLCYWMLHLSEEQRICIALFERVEDHKNMAATTSVQMFRICFLRDASTGRGEGLMIKCEIFPLC